MDPQRMFGMTPWVRRLIVANLVVFLLQVTLFVSPGFIGTLGLTPLYAFRQPWTFVTYMFVHANLLHLAFNLLARSEEHTSELQSLTNLVCRLLLEKKKQKIQIIKHHITHKINNY